MDPRIIFNLNNPVARDYLCEESRRCFFQHPQHNELRSMNEAIALAKLSRDYIQTHLSQEDADDVDKWIRRMEAMESIYDLAVLGGDLHPTEEFRVLNGNPVFTGTEEECREYLRGSHFTFKKGNKTVSQDEDWDKVIDPEGRVGRSIEYFNRTFVLQQRHYDAIDDYEIWRDV